MLECDTHFCYLKTEAVQQTDPGSAEYNSGYAFGMPIFMPNSAGCLQAAVCSQKLLKLGRRQARHWPVM